MLYKCYETDCTDPYMNLAVEEALLNSVSNNEVTLFLWQNEHTIVIGRNQNIFSECKEREFIKSGGRIARRKSGGGAVYHDLGNLNYSILSKKKEHNYQELIGNVLTSFGIAVNYNGRNDLEIDGKKFSGNAVYNNGKAYCQHGTLLVDCAIEEMNYYLTPEKSKLERNHIQSVASRVMNLSEVDSRITIDSLKQAIKDFVGAEQISFDDSNSEVMELYSFYMSKEWIINGIQ